MALPSSGAISLSDVNTNIGASSTATITMNDTAVRLLSNGNTSTNPVTMSGLYGKSWVWATNVSLSGATTFTPQSTATDSDGNSYYVAVGPTGGEVIFKVNPVGILQWARRVDPVSGSYYKPASKVNSLTVDGSGNVYYACVVELVASPYTRNMGVVKLNASGVVQWSSFLGFVGSSYNPVCSVGVDSSGNVYLCNCAESFAGTGSSFLAKYNSSGTLQWQKGIAVLTYLNLGGIVVDSTNNYVYLSGYRFINYTNDGAYIGKFDTNLSPSWERLLSNPSGVQIQFYGAAVNPSTQKVTCMVGSPVLGAASFNSSGTLQWQTTLPSSSTWYYVAVDSSDNSYILAKYLGLGTVMKLNSSGSYVSAVTITSLGSPGFVYAGGLAVNGGYVYTAQDTNLSTGASITGGSLIKIPTSLSVSGTYGRVSFSSPSITTSTSAYSASSVTATISTSPFTSFSSLVALTDVTSSWTNTVYPI